MIHNQPQPMSFESNGSKSGKSVRTIPLDRLLSPEHQPRRYFDGEAMQQLIASIKENGILQPLLVRPVGDKYELVAGERRLKAARTDRSSGDCAGDDYGIESGIDYR